MKYDSFPLFEKNVSPIVLCCNCSWKVLVNVSITTHPESVCLHSRGTCHMEPSEWLSRTVSWGHGAGQARPLVETNTHRCFALHCVVLCRVGGSPVLQSQGIM